MHTATFPALICRFDNDTWIVLRFLMDLYCSLLGFLLLVGLGLYLYDLCSKCYAVGVSVGV